jgi:tetratricopeptide (TPR) repeat protein
MVGLRIRNICKLSLLLVLTLLFTAPLHAQKSDLKQRAMSEFEKGNYPEAVSLLKRAVLENPTDAEIYYYLGYYTHYLCYDFGPRKYDEDKSDEILEYLSKAVALDPHYGNAYYFIGSEHGLRGHFAMIEGNIDKTKMELRAGREKGGYPDWLVEYARDMLSSCDSNAILFSGGDAETNPAWYLQFVEDYRTDVAVIPVGLLDFNLFAVVAKRGIEGFFDGVPTSFSEEQILSMHSRESKSEKIGVPISEIELQRLNIPITKNVMEWELRPDILRDSLELLSPSGAIIADIVKTNVWERPIYFSLGSRRDKRASLNPYLQLCGLTWRLLPVEVEKYGLSINPQEIERVLLKPESYKHFSDVKKHDMPRVSFILNNYRAVLFQLARYYAESGKNRKGVDILDKMTTYMPEDAFPSRAGFKEAIEELRSKLEAEEK